MTDASTRASEAAESLRAATGVDHFDIALILGSGWGGAADLIGEEVASVPAADLPGFDAHAVAGHSAEMRALRTEDGRHVLVLGARQHYYQVRDAGKVAHAVRMAAAAGCTQLVITNGCGSTRPEVGPGSVVLMADHINATGATPLEGATFVDMTQTYSPRLRDLALAIDPELPSGVYIQFSGPQYETPAEVRMATTLGADLVGMSTALEAIAAREAGLEILGLSLVTNLAAGIGGENLNHQEVLDVGSSSGPRISRLLADIVEGMR
ncbi:purine-nucleoside phosphorylase [Demequina muriae]|uniref:Purine nucleoside phosphorylase n=1 Tax=Demequina muriae TaxID=3051664 RepID=A0ABT8GG86_9MICO|nr:purine-nucleoside phosphorylase [Demequina sp. EGI L300058]MDN4479956.1 purine-nucleoside phosphorylase [Demequina sp. EGI L300058]